jgi:predicted extracellular nuclease
VSFVRRAGAAVALAAAVLVLGPASVGAAPSTDLFISEYIEGTSNNKALEIYNGTGSPVNLTTGAYGIQMFFNGSSTAGLTINLNGTIAPGDVFVLAQTLAAPAILAQADQTSSAGWFNGDDAVALVRAGQGLAMLDVIGQIGVDPGVEWGSDLASTMDNTLRRKAGITDGDPNGGDAFDPAVEWDGFATDTFGGLGLHTTGGDAAPIVSVTSPANGASGVALDANVTITFSEAVAVTPSWYSIVCATSGTHMATQSGGPTTFTLDPVGDFVQGESCTVTVFAAQVADTDSDDPPNEMAADSSFSFTTVAPPPEIAEIQGAAHISPKNGLSVSGVEGIVTARRTAGGRGVWIQDPTPDADPATSDAVFVFVNAAPAAEIGDHVRVNGTVSEFRAGNDPDNLTITQITSSNANVSILSRGNPVPAPTVLGAGGRMPPTEVIDDDGAGNVESGGTFDPAGDAIDFYESLEGMILRVDGAAVVGATRSFGEITLLPNGGTWATGLRTPRGGILLGGYLDSNPERITVDDEILRDLVPPPAPRPVKAMPDMNVGDVLTSSVTGPLDYSFSNYKIQATTTPSFLSAGIPRETTEAPIDQEVAVATFNVENLAGTDPQAKYDHLATLIVTNLVAPDIIGIEEVQDNDGVAGGTNSLVVDASVSWSRLTQAIQSAGGPLYEYRQIDPVAHQDGGAPGGNIRVGFLFRTDRGVSFVDRPGGGSTVETTLVDTPSGPQLSASPGRLGTKSEAFTDTRKSLVGEFRAHGKKLFVVVNHFSSKGDDQPLFGPAQPPTRFSEIARHGQAAVVHDFVADLLALDAGANVVVLGDINDFEFSETVNILEEEGDLHTLVKDLSPAERYSYVFEGNSQVLDQILIGPNIRDNFPHVYDIVHVNSEFADAVQASDHEPAVARIDFRGRPTPKG